MKIVGIVFAQNEWGLIAVSISHALINHIDEVYVVDHASTDQTFNGLNHLKKLWGERLHVITINNIGFFQEAATNTIIQISKKSNPDWIYVFDADEFLLVDESTSLKKILSNTEKCHQAIRYTVNNYISTRHFNDLILDNYKNIIHKSVTNPDIEKKANKRPYKRLTKNKTIPELIYDGDATFFDIPFPSKVIIRLSDFLQITAGAHSANYFKGNVQGKHIKEIEATHLTYPTKKRLQNKAEHGEFLIKNKFSPNHGWQMQLVYKIAQEGRLDWFWEKHSMSDKPTSKSLGPAHIIDRRFSEIITRTTDFLEKGFQSKDLSMIGEKTIEKGSGDETKISISEMIILSETLQTQNTALIDNFYKTLREKPLYRLLKIAKHVEREIRKRTRF